MNHLLASHNVPPSVELHIEQLVLHGFAPGDRRSIQEAVQIELERLFTERGLPPSLAQSGEHPRMDAGEFRLAAHSRAETVGRQIARTLYEGFQPTTGSRPAAGPGGASP
jgi:hypothetical protein